MALIQVNYMSKALFRIVPLSVILPVDRFDADTNRYLMDQRTDQDHRDRDQMTDRVNDSGWSRSEQYQRLSAFEKKLLMDFVNNAVLGAYRQWVEEGKTLPMEEVIGLTNRIVLGGVNGFFRQ